MKEVKAYMNMMWTMYVFTDVYYKIPLKLQSSCLFYSWNLSSLRARALFEIFFCFFLVFLYFLEHRYYID